MAGTPAAASVARRSASSSAAARSLTRGGGAFGRLQLGDPFDQRRFVGRRVDGSQFFEHEFDSKRHRRHAPIATLNRVSAKGRIRVARVYDDVGPDEGQRVLVDRVWPRGVRKDDPRVGIWCKNVAPSKDLREWYQHDKERFDEFASRYKSELRDSGALDELRKLAKGGPVTLVTATRDLDISQAAVLAALLKSH